MFSALFLQTLLWFLNTHCYWVSGKKKNSFRPTDYKKSENSETFAGLELIYWEGKPNTFKSLKLEVELSFMNLHHLLELTCCCCHDIPCKEFHSCVAGRGLCVCCLKGRPAKGSLQEFRELSVALCLPGSERDREAAALLCHSRMNNNQVNSGLHVT